MTDPAVGACAECRLCRVVQAERSTFYLCERSRTDPRFPRYPALPVRVCPGYERREEPDRQGGTFWSDKLSG